MGSASQPEDLLLEERYSRSRDESFCVGKHHYIAWVDR
ncbi:hypothetical protein NPIL_470631, partial [Nephila pilipes]